MEKINMKKLTSILLAVLMLSANISNAYALNNSGNDTIGGIGGVTNNSGGGSNSGSGSLGNNSGFNGISNRRPGKVRNYTVLEQISEIQ
jgi:hypothetical protein